MEMKLRGKRWNQEIACGWNVGVENHDERILERERHVKYVKKYLWLASKDRAFLATLQQ